MGYRDREPSGCGLCVVLGLASMLLVAIAAWSVWQLVAWAAGLVLA